MVRLGASNSSRNHLYFIKEPIGDFHRGPQKGPRDILSPGGSIKRKDSLPGERWWGQHHFALITMMHGGLPRCSRQALARPTAKFAGDALFDELMQLAFRSVGDRRTGRACGPQVAGRRGRFREGGGGVQEAGPALPPQGGRLRAPSKVGFGLDRSSQVRLELGMPPGRGGADLSSPYTIGMDLAAGISES